MLKPKSAAYLLPCVCGNTVEFMLPSRSAKCAKTRTDAQASPRAIQNQILKLFKIFVLNELTRFLIKK